MKRCCPQSNPNGGVDRYLWRTVMTCAPRACPSPVQGVLDLLQLYLYHRPLPISKSNFAQPSCALHSNSTGFAFTPFLPSWQYGSNDKAVVACRERKKGLPPKIWHPQLFHTLAPRLPSNNAGQGVLVPLRCLASCKYNPLRDLQMASISRHPITQLLQQE